MATPGGTFAFADPQPTDGAVIEDSTTGDVTGGIYSTSYTIEYTTPDCTTTGEITFTVLDGDDSSFEMTPTCDGAVVDTTTLATPGGTFAFADPQPTDGAVIDSTTGEVTGGIYSTSYTIEYTTPDCTTTGEFTFTTLDGDDSSFEMTPTCDGAVVDTTTLATPGGTFAFADPQPTDGAVMKIQQQVTSLAVYILHPTRLNTQHQTVQLQERLLLLF